MVYSKRITKLDEETHKNECLQNAPHDYLEKLDSLADKKLIQDVAKQLQRIFESEKGKPPGMISFFNLGFWTLMLFSCLIDADRISSADFEYPENSQYRNNTHIDWSIPAYRLEQFISQFKGENL